MLVAGTVAMVMALAVPVAAASTAREGLHRECEVAAAGATAVRAHITPSSSLAEDVAPSPHTDDLCVVVVRFGAARN